VIRGAPAPALEELDLPLMLLGGRTRLERAQVPASTGLGIFPEGVEAVQTGGQLSNHRGVTSMVLRAGTPETSGPSVARRQLRDLFELHCLDTLKYQLGDPHTSLDGDGLGAEVDHRDEELASVVRVDGRGCVREREAVLQREAGARAHLSFVPGRDGEREPGANQTTLERLECEVGVGAGQIVPRRAGRLSGR
jgi:hypothetical protein